MDKPWEPLPELLEITRRHNLLTAKHLVLSLMTREARIREMLGRWVSELEPIAVYDRSGIVLGLTFDGIPVGVVAPICVRPS